MTTILGLMTDTEILAEVAARIRGARLDRNVSVEEASKAAGISKTTWANAEGGGDVRLATLIRMLRALGRLENLETFLPPVIASPLSMVERGTQRVRERASGSRTRRAGAAESSHASEPEPSSSTAPVFPQPGGVASIGVSDG